MKTILVVDDSSTDRLVIGELLGRVREWKVEYADNGCEALARIEAAVPSVVITDLQMPEMDGLELVTQIRRHFPQVPVILITAQGSESLAVEALKRGAAHYVPKSQAAERLVSTVQDVFGVVLLCQNYKHLIQCMDRTEFEFSLRSQPGLIDPLVDLVQRMMVGMQLCDLTGRIQVGVALREALWNALLHGNLELRLQNLPEAPGKLMDGGKSDAIKVRCLQSPYRDRRIHVAVKILRTEARVVIRDEGAGFNVAAIPALSDPVNMEAVHGRGLSLMRAFMDEVSYNDVGNEVTIVKRRDSRAKAVDIGWDSDIPLDPGTVTRQSPY
jgi:CheY-like chemotaxis protein